MKSSRLDYLRSPQSRPLSSNDGIGDDQQIERGFKKTRIPQMMQFAAGRHSNLPGKAAHDQNDETNRPRSATTRHPPAHPSHLLQEMRQTRQSKEKPVLKRPPNLIKKTLPSFRPSTPVIKVPLTSAPIKTAGREDQDTDGSVCSHTDPYGEMKRGEPKFSTADMKTFQLMNNWQKDFARFESMKRQLNEKQRDLLVLYATLRSSQKQLLDMGQTMSLPPSEELEIMNVTQLTAEQLLQLCVGTEVSEITNAPDFHILREIPNKILATCEQSLNSRKEIVDWFEEIITSRMITKNVLVTKIKQFKSENEEFKKSLDENKDEYLRFFNDTDYCFKDGSNSTTYQLSFQFCLNKLSETNALRDDLEKKLLEKEGQVIAAECKSKELEKQLWNEKERKRDHLSRANLNCKSREEKIAQISATLEQANSRCLSLGKTVCQLREENQEMKSSYDQKLQKLNESIAINSQVFEEITADRSKLLAEKQDLEKQLVELGKNFEETLHNTRHESNLTVARLMETEKKYSEALEERSKLADKIESMCTQLLDSELRFKDVSVKLAEAELVSRDVEENRKEIEMLNCQLKNAKEEVLDYKNILTKQHTDMNELQQIWNNALISMDLLKNDLNSKEISIGELEEQLTALKQGLLDSESKTKSYAEELSNLQNKIASLRELFGDLKSFEELYETIKQQTIELKEANLQKDSLIQALKEKDIELQQGVETLTNQRALLEDREAALKMLMDKHEEQSNLVNLLRNNLDERTQADIEINRQIDEKNAEIESLISNVEKRKQQILQLEKIILTLENQVVKLSNQKRSAREAISSLGNKLSEYESYYSNNAKKTGSSTDNLDDLINILEYELTNSSEDKFNRLHQELRIKNNTGRQNKRRSLNSFQMNPENDSDLYRVRKNVAVKLGMENNLINTNILNKDNNKGDGSSERDALTKAAASAPKDSETLTHQTTNVNYCFIPKYIRNDKKLKMFKLAGHKLQ